ISDLHSFPTRRSSDLNAVFIARMAKDTDKLSLRHVDAASSLNGFNKNSSNLVATDQTLDFQPRDLSATTRAGHRATAVGARRKVHEMLELAELRLERFSKMGAVCRTERSIAGSVVRTTENDDAALASGQ